jgi:hypothetical protein
MIDSILARDGRRKLALPRSIIAGLLALLLLAAAGCGAKKTAAPPLDPERTAWATLRGFDAGIESATRDYERWKTMDPPVFTARELENLRAGLWKANESLGAAHSAFEAFRAVRHTAAQRDAQSALDAAIAAVEKSYSALWNIWQLLRQKEPAPAPDQAQIPLMWMLLTLIGEFLRALGQRKKAEIYTSALNVFAAVQEAVKESTGEDLDIGSAQLGQRIAERRIRLRDAAVETEAT